MNAQTEERAWGTTTKSGHQILPQAGDIAIGVDATPFLEYVGNIFTDGYNNAPTFGDVTLFGKYFLSPDRAIRAKLDLNLNHSSFEGAVSDDNDLTTSLATVNDIKKTNTVDIKLNAGYEFRRGYGRLQGFWGAGISLLYWNETFSCDYGNNMTKSNPTPSTTDFSTGMTINPSMRTIDNNSGNRFGFGVNGFAGIEYFVAPKLSLGAELSIDLVYAMQSKQKSTIERYNPTTNNIEKLDADIYDPQSPKSFIGLGTITAGNLYVMFHF